MGQIQHQWTTGFDRLSRERARKRAILRQHRSRHESIFAQHVAMLAQQAAMLAQSMGVRRTFFRFPPRSTRPRPHPRGLRDRGYIPGSHRGEGRKKDSSATGGVAMASATTLLGGS